MDAKVCRDKGGIWNLRKSKCILPVVLDGKKFKTVSKNYATILTNYNDEWNRLERKKKVLEKKLDRLDRLERPYWGDWLIKPIAEAIVKKMPNRRYEILGPFGLNAETSIHFYKKGVSEKELFKKDNCLSLTFRPGELDEGELRIVDLTVNTGRFAVGSIGEMNRMNYPDKPIPPDADAKWFIAYMKDQEKRG